MEDVVPCAGGERGALCGAASNSSLSSAALIRSRAFDLGICMKNPDGLIGNCD